jgi:XTP/dITP diphosphohydrolase
MGNSQVTANQTYQEVLSALEHLIQVVAKLRSPDGGCPWDLAQTPESLIPYVIEEAYEVVDAIRSGNQIAIAEELGDLLLQVVLQAQIASESGHFSLKEVTHQITEKLIRRHPHVFGDVDLQTPEEVRQQWEVIKSQEKGDSPSKSRFITSRLSRYARTLPPLMAASKISQKAAEEGFEWEHIDGVWAKFEEELAEFKEAAATENKQHASEELGDLLFTIINIARWYDLDPSSSLQETNQRFIQRLSKVEGFATKPLQEYSLAELETLWQKAKQELSQS